MTAFLLFEFMDFSLGAEWLDHDQSHFRRTDGIGSYLTLVLNSVFLTGSSSSEDPVLWTKQPENTSVNCRLR